MKYQPDFEAECRICGSSPCVVVVNHDQPDTELCGTCFFQDTDMLDWNNWNEEEDSDE